MKRLLITILIFFASTAFAKDNIVNVYNWAGYMPPEVIALFQKETGIKVNYSTFDSNEDLYTKLKANSNIDYDIAVPSAPYVQQMIRDGMLRRLDKSKLIGFKNLNSTLLNQSYDPNNQYSIPYLWGTTGIIINTKYYSPKKINYWEALWQPQFRGQLSFINDMKDVFAMALKVLGYSINDQNPKHIREAYLKLKALLPNIQSFEAGGAKHLYVNEDSNIGMIESGDAYIISQEKPSFKYIYPKDGPLIWTDNMVIPIGAKHVENAYEFINFILRPDIAKMISLGVGFSTPNAAAVKLLPKAAQENRVLNPTAKDLQNGEVEGAISLKTRGLYLKYWELLKLGGGI